MRAGKPADGELETDCALVTTVCATATHHAFSIQALSINLGGVVPRGLSRVLQRIGCAGCCTIATKGAFAAFKINLRVVFFALDQNVFRAGVNTIVALGAAFKKGFNIDRPRGCHDVGYPTPVSAQKLPAIN